jgi:hypothetical protein
MSISTVANSIGVQQRRSIAAVIDRIIDTDKSVDNTSIVVFDENLATTGASNNCICV